MVFAFAGLSTINKFFDIVGLEFSKTQLLLTCCRSCRRFYTHQTPALEKKIRQPHELTVTVDTTAPNALSTSVSDLMPRHLHTSCVILAGQNADQVANIQAHERVVQIAE